jgi:hypothetical protein
VRLSSPFLGCAGFRPQVKPGMIFHSKNTLFCKCPSPSLGVEADDPVDLPEAWQHDAGNTGNREAVRPLHLSRPGMRRAMAPRPRAVGADPLADEIAHSRSECPTPTGRDAEERRRRIWVEGLDGVANPRD